MFKDWNVQYQSSFNKSYSKIDWLIKLVTSIRSTKVNLGVSPGAFIDISTAELSSSKKRIINDNLNVFKRLGRISEILEEKENKKGVKIVVGEETVILYFDKKINLHEQIQKISNKIKDIEHKIMVLNKKLENESFLKNAPKLIVMKEKEALIGYKIALKKLNSILNSIKN